MVSGRKVTYVSKTKHSSVVQHFPVNVILHYKSKVTGFDSAYSWDRPVKYVTMWWEMQVVHVRNL